MKWHKFKNDFRVQFFLMCVLVGIASVLFTWAVDFAAAICRHVFALNWWAMFIYIPLLFVVIVYLLHQYFPYAGGSGLPQGYAVDVFDAATLRKTYSLRSLVGKVVLTFMSIAAGASLGKEGPTIQICSSLFAQIRHISDKKRRLLIKLGAGVGVAAAFNTPIGGMVFALEEYVKKITPKIAVLLVGATLVAVFVAEILAGNQPYMGAISGKLLEHGWQQTAIALLVGVLCGLSGALFTKLMVFISVDESWKINQLRRKHYLVNAFIFGLLVALLGYLSLGLSFGNGSDATRHFLDQGVNAPWYYGLAKFFGALASVGGNVPGGYFSTALSIGAGIGDLIHHFIPSTPLVQFYLLGMTGFLAAITQSPITAVAMVVEMSDSSQFTLPILVSAFLASVIAERFGASVYHQQVLNYIDKDRYSETV